MVFKKNISLAGWSSKTLVAAVLIVSMGCTGSIDELRSDISRLERNLGDVRTRQAEQTSAMVSLEERMRHLAGRIEEVEYLQRSRVGVDISALKKDLNSLQRRMPPPTVVSVKALQEDEKLLKKLPRETAGLFADLLTELRTGKFSEALVDAERALSIGYGAEGTAELLFWKGIALDGLGENEKAIEAYNELIGQYPKHQRTALGLLRLASVFVRMGDLKTAKVVFHKLVADFPKSEESAHARERIREMK